MICQKRALKICAGVAGAVLTAVLLIGIAFSFGNPVSGYFAGQKMQQYLDKEYPYRRLKIAEIRYGPGFGDYYAQAVVPGVETSYFTVYFQTGKCHDSYDEDLETGRELLSRQEKIRRDAIKPILETVPELKIWIEALEPQGEAPLLDPPYRTGMEASFELMINCTAETPTIEYAADVMRKVCTLMEQNGFRFERYRIDITSAENSADAVIAYGFTSEIIQSENFEDLLKRSHSFVEFPSGSEKKYEVYDAAVLETE